MTIDERLEKLTERHEALTQSVELMVAENRANFLKLTDAMNRMVTNTEALTRLVADHEHRIKNLEQ